MIDAPQPQSRRELRELERAAAASAATERRGVRRVARNTLRRDAAHSTAPETPAGDASSPSRPSTARTIGSRLLSFGAMIFAAALAVGMTVPANAIAPIFGTSTGDAALADTFATEPREVETQTVKVDAAADGATALRDGWTVTSWAQMLRDRYGTRDYSYNAGGMGPIRWPFPVAVPVSSGYGERVAPCRGCSTSHKGVDFNPGNGAAIFAIADGVVVEHEDGGGGFGNYVILEHQIDGHVVQSTYAHMQTGSSPLVVGESISVGEFVGLVGSTGQATGPHLHLEITVDGEHVDPFAWLKAHAG